MHSRFTRTTAVAALFSFLWGTVAVDMSFAVGEKRRNAPSPPSVSASTSSAEERPAREAAEPAGELKVLKGRARARKAQLDAQRNDLLSEFAETENFLKSSSLTGEILSRHRQYVKRFEKEMAGLIRELDNVAVAGSEEVARSSLEKVRSKVEGRGAPKRGSHFDPERPPFRSPPPVSIPPRTRPEEFRQNISGSDEERRPLLASKELLPGLLAASTGESLLLAETSTPSPPAAEDLAGTPDAPISPAILAKAEELGRNPVAIFNWVRNNVDFLPTFHSVQGAETTLIAGRGNAFDTSSLLIALLRASGVPARYVEGTIEISAERLMNWLGVDSDAELAAELLGFGGISALKVVSGGKITSIRLEHVWVEAWVDYTPSRGARNISGDRWIPLDASFKEYEAKAPIDMEVSLPFDIQNLMSSYAASGEVNEAGSFATGFDESILSEALTGYADRARSHFRSERSAATVADVLGNRFIVPREDPFFLGTLPYTVLASGEGKSSLSSAERHNITVKLSTGSTPVISFSSSYPELSNKRVGITYIAATPEDEALLRSYEESGATSLPVYLVKVKPVLTVDGKAVSEGVAVGMGQEQCLDVVITDPAGRLSGTERYTVAAGDELVFGLNGNGITAGMVKERLTKASVASAAENLHQAALHYWLECETLEEIAARTYGVKRVRLPSVGLFSSPLVITYDFWGMNPRFASYKGRMLDLTRPLTGVAARDGAAKLAYMLQAGIQGSFLEGAIFSQLFGKPEEKSVSAAQVLWEANKEGIPIYLITDQNMGLIDAVSADNQVKTELITAVEWGYVAIVPKHEITRGTWSGTGYILLDPDTGAGAYRLAGEQNGGNGMTCAPKVSPQEARKILDSLNALLESLIFGFIAGPDSSGGVSISYAYLAKAGLLHLIPDLQGGWKSVFSAIPSILYIVSQLRIALIDMAVLSSMDEGDLGLDCECIEDPQEYEECMNGFDPGGGGDDSGGDCDVGGGGGGAGPGGGGASPPPLDTRSDQSVSTGSRVHLYFRDYRDRIEDMAVKAPGGRLTFTRHYYKDSWHFDFSRQNLTFKKDSSGEIKSVVKDGVRYARESSQSESFVYKTDLIARDGAGWLWKDRHGNWMRFSKEGLLLSHGSPAGALGEVLYDEANPGRAIGMADGSGRQVFWFTFGADGRLSEVRDLSGRTVSYSYEDGVEGSIFWVRDVRGKTIRYRHDRESGRLLEKTDPEGNSVLIGTDAEGMVSSVTDSLGDGYFFSFGTEAGKRYGRMKTSDGRSKEVLFDASGDTIKVMEGGATVKSIEKDRTGISVTDALGRVTRKDVDDFENVTGVVYPDGTTASFEYDPRWNKVTAITDELGRVTKYTYDDAGNLTLKVEALGADVERTTEYVPDEHGNIREITRLGDANTPQSVTLMEYDSLGNMVALTDAENRRTEFKDHDVMGNARTVIDGRGKTWSFVFDGAGRMDLATDPLGNTTDYEYDDLGNLDFVKDAEGKVTDYAFDGKGRLKELIDGAGGKRSYVYDVSGRVTRMSDPESKITELSYDARGRLAKRNDVDGEKDINVIRFSYTEGSGCSSCSGRSDAPNRIAYPTFTREIEYDRRGRKTLERDILSGTEAIETSFGYDAAGNLTSVTDGEGRRTAYHFDALNRMDTSTDALNGITHHTHDSRDNLISLKDAKGNTTRFEYDRTNRVLKEIRPMGEEMRFTYNGAGALEARIDAKGRKKEIVYDDAGREELERYYATDADTEPEKTVTLSFDKTGHPTGYDDGVTSALYGYDGAYRKTSETVNYGTFALSRSASWYKNGVKKSDAGPSGMAVEYLYDYANRLKSVSIPGAGSIVFDSYKWTKPTEIKTPDGTVRSVAYDPLLRIREIIANTNSGEQVMASRYTYNGVNQVISRETARGPELYGYDELSRLTAASIPELPNDELTYDAIGNRETSIQSPGPWTYNDNSELESYGGITFTFDANGNTETKTEGGKKTVFFYDFENRLERVENGSGTVIAKYGYDHFGRRLWKEAGGSRTYFFYSDEGLIGEYDETGSEIRSYGYKPGSPFTTDPLFMKDESGYFFYQNDHLGTPRVMPDSGGSVAWSAKYAAFGEATVGAGSRVTNNLRFAGQYFDAETGLHYNWHRYYDPKTGRYGTVDPIGLRERVNLYLYTENNPINYMDPKGLIVYYCYGVYRTYDHAVVCLDGKCAGLMPGGVSLIFGLGQIQDEKFRDDLCTPKDVDETKGCDQVKYEQCIQREAVDKIGTERGYGLLTYNCISWATDVIIRCQKEACGQ